MARHLGLQEADAEDAVQETFIELWKCASRYDSRVASEATFVRVLAKRRIMDRYRRQRRAPTIESLSDDRYSDFADDSTSTDSLVEMDRLRGALNILPPDKRRIVEMSVWRGLSHGEIADATGMALGTVKTTIRRGLSRVRDHIRKSRVRLAHSSAEEFRCSAWAGG